LTTSFFLFLAGTLCVESDPFMSPRVTEAARECVANCENWNKPLPEISSYVQRLLDVPGWPPKEANEVGRVALRILDPQHPLLKNGD